MYRHHSKLYKLLLLNYKEHLQLSLFHRFLVDVRNVLTDFENYTFYSILQIWNVTKVGFLCQFNDYVLQELYSRLYARQNYPSNFVFWRNDFTAHWYIRALEYHVLGLIYYHLKFVKETIFTKIIVLTGDPNLVLCSARRFSHANTLLRLNESMVKRR